MELDAGFKEWLLDQEIGFIEFLRNIYEMSDGGQPSTISLSVLFAPKGIEIKPRHTPISWSEIKQFDQFLNDKSNGIIE